jgi:hypothetical protein
MDKKWAWELGEKLGVGFQVVEFESKRSSAGAEQAARARRWHAHMPKLF